MLLEKFSRYISLLLTDKQYKEEDWIKIVYTRVTVYRDGYVYISCIRVGHVNSSIQPTTLATSEFYETTLLLVLCRYGSIVVAMTMCILTEECRLCLSMPWVGLVY